MKNTTNRIYDVPTMEYPIIRPRSTPSTKLLIKSLKPLKKRRPNHRHIVSMSMRQLIYASIAVLLSFIVYRYLAAWPVYRVVAFVVIVIIWSNLASATARKKSVDMLETVRIQAIRVGKRKQTSHVDSPALTLNTETYLQTVKASLLESYHEIH